MAFIDEPSELNTAVTIYNQFASSLEGVRLSYSDERNNFAALLAKILEEREKLESAKNWADQIIAEVAKYKKASEKKQASEKKPRPGQKGGPLPF